MANAAGIPSGVVLVANEWYKLHVHKLVAALMMLCLRLSACFCRVDRARSLALTFFGRHATTALFSTPMIARDATLV